MASNFSSLADSPALANGAVYVLVLTGVLAVQSLIERLRDVWRLERKKNHLAAATADAAASTAPKHPELFLKYHRLRMDHAPMPPPSDFGTSFGTIELVQLVALLVLNALLMVLPVEWPEDGDSAWDLAAVANRIGWVGLGNAFFIMITATRTSILTPLIGLPFERNLLYHRWFGYLIGLQITLHAILHFVYFSQFGVLVQQMAVKTNVYGAVGWSALLVLVGFSFPAVRRRIYQLFKFTHFLFILFVIFGCLHVPAMAWFIGLGAGLWLVDRAVRFWRSRQRVEVLDLVPLRAEGKSAAVKVTLKVGHGKPRHFEAGHYAFLSVPRISTYLNYHPITAMAAPDLVGSSGMAHLLEDNFTAPCLLPDGSVPDGTVVSFAIKVFGGFTGSLFDAAASGTAKAGAAQTDLELAVPAGKGADGGASPPIPRDLQLWSVDGFYGASLVDFCDHAACVLLGGGIGITPMVAIGLDMGHRMCMPLRVPRADGRAVPTLAMAARDVYFVWWTKSLAEYGWLRGELGRMMGLARRAAELGNGLHIRVFVTHEPEADLAALGYSEDEREAIRFAMEPQAAVMKGVREAHPQGDVAVAVCGPAMMIRETRNLCAGRELSNADGIFDVHWESFEY
ncbi:ferric reductase like transmembrane component-domain-containing protein [Hyaloraphidium curvatum]|nr:ferric reductase like transmembrane component-domain-containing protein [Hyaloraphidium curvatum]KAI9007005.1 ferric reductase like transmembrane component-domain-containing protein [Hyaloraphidium curvatum]